MRRDRFPSGEKVLRMRRDRFSTGEKVPRIRRDGFSPREKVSRMRRDGFSPSEKVPRMRRDRFSTAKRGHSAIPEGGIIAIRGTDRPVSVIFPVRKDSGSAERAIDLGKRSENQARDCGVLLCQCLDFVGGISFPFHAVLLHFVRKISISKWVNHYSSPRNEPL